MSKKFGLLSNLEEDVTSPKKKFQLFEAEMGFEHTQVLIPFENADAFEQAASKHPPKSASSLLRLASKFGGVAS
jgi:hypothetical protein